MKVTIALSGGRIFSAFLYNNEKFYVVSEWDRRVTTIMLASEY